MDNQQFPTRDSSTTIKTIYIVIGLIITGIVLGVLTSKLLPILKQSNLFDNLKPTPTVPKVVSLPQPYPGLSTREFVTVGLLLYAPKEWKSDIVSSPEISGDKIIFWQGQDRKTSSIQLLISNNWDNTVGQYDVRNYQINDSLQATKNDPPKKEEAVLEKYQTNYVFEKNGKVYELICVHNWVEATIQVCEDILNKAVFTKDLQ